MSRRTRVFEFPGGVLEVAAHAGNSDDDPGVYLEFYCPDEPTDPEPTAALGTLLREVAAAGRQVIITDNGTELAAIISMADYERLHEYADVADARQLQPMRKVPFETISISEMIEAAETGTWLVDGREADVILGYDEHGLPS